MSRKLHRTMKSFKADERGAVALIFGLAVLPLMGLTGAAVDFSRASAMRAKMTVASDAAVLAAVQARARSKGTTAEKEAAALAAANAAFSANLGSDGNLTNLTSSLVPLTGNNYRFTASAKYNFAIIQTLPGVGYAMDLNVASEANAGSGTVEVALVLDNTGSMKDDMTSLRKAAKDFTNILFDYTSSGGELKISVVPYVASVNPGRLNLGMSAVDTHGDSQWQAKTMRWRWIGFLHDCRNNGNWDPPKGGGGGGGSKPPPDYGTGGKGAWLQDAARKLAGIGRELFGIREAAAQGVFGTPNRAAPFTGTEHTVKKPKLKPDGKIDEAKVFVPTGFNYDSKGSPCVIANPGKIANLDLFEGIRMKDGTAAQWKGCVEARPEPFDVTDDPPLAGNPATRFTPYFWPDEPGKGGKGSSQGYVNNYMDDGDLPPGWNNQGGQWERHFNLFKYDGVNKNVNFSPNPPDTSGPNMACPDELLRLTSNRTTVLNKINDLSHWNGGGTISSEGIMWGWRTLSPKAPFSDGKPYDTEGNKKILVLMTDGENEIGASGPTGGPVLSQYSAYGPLRDGRFPKQHFQEAAKHLDSRMSLACENAKKAGVQVITILFRVDSANAKDLLEKCATSNKLFYMAKNQTELEKAFVDVAETIGRIRLTK